MLCCTYVVRRWGGQSGPGKGIVILVFFIVLTPITGVKHFCDTISFTLFVERMSLRIIQYKI